MKNFLRSKRGRITLGIFLPPFIGSLVFFIPASFECAVESKPSLACDFALASIMAAYLVIGIPSVAYSLMMEYLFNPKIKNNKLFLFVSTVLGALAGSVFGFSPLIIIGAIVGLVTGALLRRNYETDIANKRMQPDRQRLRRLSAADAGR